MKVYLSPSDQVSNTYCVGGTNEAAQCREICQLTVEALKRCGIDAKTNVKNGMGERVAESNAWGADLHVPVHTNGFNGTADGTLLMCYDLKGEGYKASKAIFDVLAPMSPGSDYSIQARPDLYEVRASNAPCAYVEVAFHDNKVEAQWILDHKKEIAEALAKGICNYGGIEYKPEEAKMEEAGSYVVQSGLIDSVELAEEAVKALKSCGVDATLMEVIH